MAETLQEIQADLDTYIGKRVRVAITEDGYSRNHFGPQIAVAGKLEKRGEDKYRVACDDDNFSYFTPREVVLVNPLASVPTIMLKIDVDTEEE